MSQTDRLLDAQIRMAAFRFLEEQVARHGEALDRNTLEHGFEFRGQMIKLVGPQGIFKPKILSDYPISITTVAPKPGQPRPYDDGFLPDGTVSYRYRGTDPEHPENRRLRAAMRDKVPLIYFHGTVPGRYVAAWPVYIIGDDPRSLAFHVDVDRHRATAAPSSESEDFAEDVLDRRYAIQTTHRRLHQQAFRDRVLKAYREQCAICRLRRTGLLDAAHIIPDSDPDGEPRVSNGLSLCKLHHAAFDQQLLAIRPDLVIEVPLDVLEETDGPMLQAGLQSIHGQRIQVPRRADWQPDRLALERRYEEFQQRT